MLTLADIDAMFPDSHSGSVYSDLYKDVYGSRPRGCAFASIEEFDRDFEFLVQQLKEEETREAERQARAAEQLEQRIADTQALVQGADRLRALEIIAEAEGIDAEERRFYNWESLEWTLGLKYGYIRSKILA